MKTRQDYLDGGCTHSEYYSQFVNNGIIELVKNGIGIDKLIKSKDESFNDIPLAAWDRIASLLTRVEMKPYGDYLTLSGQVCILKEAARQIVKEA